MYYHVFNNGMGYDQDDEEPCGRLLTQAEYTEKLKARTDIFTSDKNYFLRKTEAFCLSLAFLFGLWLPGMEVITIPIDMIAPAMAFEKPTSAPTVELIREPIDINRQYTKIVDRPKVLKRNTVKKSIMSGSNGSRGTGGGNYLARVMEKGVLGLVHGLVSGSEIYGDIFGKGGYTKNIDAILSGMGGLKKGSDGGAGRMGEGVIGFGKGDGGGFGNNPGSVDASIENLMQADNEALIPTKPTLVKRGFIIHEGGGLTKGGRNKKEISRVVQQNISALRYAYNRRLREKPGLDGKIRLRFAIDEFGRVIFCEVVHSSMNDARFEKLMVAKIEKWAFEKIDKPGDVTEVVYPFVFSM